MWRGSGKAELTEEDGRASLGLKTENTKTGGTTKRGRCADGKAASCSREAIRPMRVCLFLDACPGAWFSNDAAAANRPAQRIANLAGSRTWRAGLISTAPRPGSPSAQMFGRKENRRVHR